MAIDVARLDAAVSKFRSVSPNVAKAFDEMKAIILVQDKEIASLKAKVAAAVPPASATLNQVGSAVRKLG